MTMNDNGNVSVMTLIGGIAIGICIGLAVAPKPDKNSDDARSTRARFETVTAAGILFCIDKTNGETWMMCRQGNLYEGWGYLGVPQNPVVEAMMKKLTPPPSGDTKVQNKNAKPWEEDLSAYSDEDLEKIVADAVIAASNSTPPKAENP